MGPKLWAASRLPFIYYLLTGQLVRRVKEFHDIYGEFYRLAPDEVSFASEQAWNDIYTFRRGHKRAGRDKVWYIGSEISETPPNNQADNLITTTDFKFHARVRGLLSNSFTDESLRTQHPLIQSHADMLISKIKEYAEKPENSVKGARINITDWLNFFTMDIIGDLAFGAPFGCLEKGEYHHWVRTLFSYLKGMSIAAAPRFYPTMEFLFQKLIPKSVIEGQKHHSAYAEKMINRRLDTKSDRPDFMTLS
ncbi:cytochrome P450 monooxygenase protein [Rutstroemia sp. NJR-2017a WRK4]|nr:cytochrome P450 monooxygenase protein [Rutstroemia sp. NJR-2017a WRK4]